MADEPHSPSSTAPKLDSAASDSAFERLLAEVASAPSSDVLLEGTLVGEYRLIRQLGKGTFGTVYHGAHTVIGKQVALKVLNAHFSSDPRTAARFIDEARAVNRITHPNIVDIFGFGSLEDGRKYCVMELLEGQTLTAFLAAQGGHCPWPTAALIPTQVAAALDAAHDSGVVHRDLKPDNIFIIHKPHSRAEASLHVKLLDFGVARISDSAEANTESGAVLGTPAYMSPEQCRGLPVDRRTDVYALGVVAFQMLTGKPPFRGKNALQLIAQQINDTPPLPSDVNPKLSSAVDAVFSRLLAKLPERRPERASDAVSELLNALGQSERRPLAAVAGKVGRRAWGRPLLIGIGALALLGGAALALRARAPAAERIPSHASDGMPSANPPTPQPPALAPSFSAANAPGALLAGPSVAPAEASASASASARPYSKKPVAPKRHDNPELEF